MRTPRNEAVAADIADTDVAGASPSPQRTCVLTRQVKDKDALIRLALSPDGVVAPDVRARAPGRGAYVGTTRAELDAANAKGKLQGQLARTLKADVTVPADLGELIEAALRQAALDRLGLEARGGTLLTGAERVEQAARMGKVHLLIHAGDAGADGKRRLDQAWRVGGGGPRGLEFPEGRTILSAALGRENAVHVALTDAAAARRVRAAIDRWQNFIGVAPDAGLLNPTGLEAATSGEPLLAPQNEDEGNP